MDSLRGPAFPVSQDCRSEMDKLKNSEDQLHLRVIGQDDAVSAVLQRSVVLAQTHDPNKPLGSFLFPWAQLA